MKCEACKQRTYKGLKGTVEDNPNPKKIKKNRNRCERVSTYLVGNIFQESALVALNQYVIETTGHYKSWRA